MPPLLSVIFRPLSGMTRTPLFTAVLAALVLLIPGSGLCFEITVIQSADLKPYEEVLEGVKDSCGCGVSVVKLTPEESSEDIFQKGSPDAVVVIGTAAFKKARSIRHLPLIYTMVMPSEADRGLQPNISGVSMDISPAEYFNSMREVFPNVKRVGLLYDPAQTGPFVKEAAEAAREAGITLVARKVSGTSDIPAVLEGMRSGIDVFWMTPDVTVVTTESVDYLLHFSFSNGLPVFSFSKKYVEMGAVAALDIDPHDMGVQAGELVKEISRGRSDGVRVYARGARLTVNKKVAQKMGLIIRASNARRDK